MIAFNREQVKKLLKNEIKHSYIEKFMEEPTIDLDKITALLFILNHKKTSEQQRQDLIIPIMLVQIALDTHENVPNETKSDCDDMRRQLSILAGDYYSGLYYYLLAKIENIPLVRSLARAIKNINEHKVILYNEEANDWEHLLFICKQIESLLFTEVSELYELSSEKISLINEILYMNRLLRELTLIENNQFSYFSHYVNHNIVQPHGESLISTLHVEIEKSRLTIEELANNLPYEFAQIKNIIFDKNALSAVEEG